MNDQVAAVTAMLAETPDSLRVWLRDLRDNRPARYRKLFAHCTPLEADALSDDQLAVNLATVCRELERFRKRHLLH
jgi:hypothetical protein